MFQHARVGTTAEELCSVLQWTMPSPGYADMVSQVRAFYQVQDEGLADPLRVVIAQRPAEQQRSITNAADLAAALQKRSLQVQVSRIWSLCCRCCLQQAVSV